MRLAAWITAATLAAAPSVFAANPMKADIPFSFQVGSKTMSAGTYDFKIDTTANTVDVQGGTPRGGAVAMIMTQLAAPPHPGQQEHAHIVFDKVGNTYTLSELWEPGSDGILVHATKGKHEHFVVHVTK